MPRLRLNDLSHVLATCFAIYVLTLPFMVWAARTHGPIAEPHGRKVEQIFPKLEPPRLEAETHLFSTADEWHDLLVYEGTQPLPRERFELKPFGSRDWRSITLKASDDTDPARNGRHYYAVLP